MVNIELKSGGQLRVVLLNSFDIVHIDSKTELVEVKKEISLLKDGELLVFNYIGKNFVDWKVVHAVIFRSSRGSTLTAK